MKKYILILLVGLVAFSCTDDFEDLNTDKKNPSVIPAEPLFSNATRNIFDLMTESNVNRNVYRLYAQYWAQTTYPDESQYNMVGRKIPDNIFNILYRDALKDLSEAKRILNSTETTNAADEAIKQNKLAVISVMESYTFGVLVDIFGDVPFSEALNDDIILPKYDDDQEVYTAVIDQLVAAIAKLDEGTAAFSANEDVIYDGDVAAWKKFAYSLQLKFAMRIADADVGRARTLAESAAPNVFTSNDDNFAITYFSSPPNTHPLYVDLVLSGRNDFVVANTLIDVMNDLSDPRRPLWFVPVGTDYLGGIYGDANAASSFSGFTDAVKMAELPGTLMSYDEVEFLLAEAAARTFNVGGTVEDHYNNAVASSIMFWGGTQQMADDYLAQPAVAYSTAAGDWKQKIGIQKWISLFNNGFEGWSTWRSLDFDAFNAPPGMSLSDIPTRFIFPIDEATLNGANLDAAASKFNNDSPTAKIFWDMN